MSNKAAGEQDAKLALTPKLRFPEFRDAAGWEEKTLGNEGDLLSSLTGKAGVDFDAGQARFVTYMNVFSNTFVDPKDLRFVDVKEGENQNAVLRGDVFFTISSETPDEVGMSSVLLEDLEKCYLNSFCALFRFSKSKRPNSLFTGYLLRQPLVRGYFTKKAQGSTRFNLSKDAFRSLPLFVPSPAEQQRIAECLTTLDEVIAAQSQKLDALKTHKKGLMQQLFPRAGETLPRLRFPEFQNAPEWAEKSIGDFGTVVTGSTPSTARRDYYGGGIPFASPADISDLRFVNGTKTTLTRLGFEETRPIRANSVLFVCIGSTIGKVAQNRRDCATNQQINSVIPDSNHSDGFVYFALSQNAERIAKLAGRQAVPIINKTLFSSVKLAVPKLREQERIASCLSSLDELILWQSKKLNALKSHKQGLMQQLFPSPTDVEA